MEEKIYRQGNKGLLTMIAGEVFDRERATQILKEIPDLNEPILDLGGYPSTYLFEAQSCNHVEAVKFLLEKGADPNYCNLQLGYCCCALDDLHFLWEEMSDQVEERLEIARLFFEYGGDPNLYIELESLYDHVRWEVFNEDVPHDRAYLHRFFLLLLAYGGGKNRQFSQAIDRSRIDEYRLKLFLCEDGYHLEGHLFDPGGNDIGTV